MYVHQCKRKVTIDFTVYIHNYTVKFVDEINAPNKLRPKHFFIYFETTLNLQCWHLINSLNTP